MSDTVSNRHNDFIQAMQKNMVPLQDASPAAPEADTDEILAEDMFPLTDEDFNDILTASENPHPDADSEYWDEVLAAEVEREYRKLFG